MVRVAQMGYPVSVGYYKLRKVVMVNIWQQEDLVKKAATLTDEEIDRVRPVLQNRRKCACFLCIAKFLLQEKSKKGGTQK